MVANDLAQQAGSASQQPQRRERPTVASRSASKPMAETSASQPITEPSDKEVYLDSDSDLLLLTTWAGRPAASHAAPAYAFARHSPLLPPVLSVSPRSSLYAVRLARSEPHCPRLVLCPILIMPS